MNPEITAGYLADEAHCNIHPSDHLPEVTNLFSECELILEPTTSANLLRNDDMRPNP